MGHHRIRFIFSVIAGAVLLSACGGGKQVSAQAGEKGESCRETPAAELTPSGHGCALAAEMSAIADTLATVADQTSAEKAVPLLKKSGQRLKALKVERLKLSDDPQAGAKGAMVGLHAPAMSAASLKIVDESMRIAQSLPQAFLTINSAMEGLEY
jgi:hypothetical protein